MAYPYDTSNSWLNPAFKKQYHDTLYLLTEQMGGKFKSKVELVPKDEISEEGIYTRTHGNRRMSEVTQIHGDTPATANTYDQRRITRTDFEDGAPLRDRLDAQRTCIDPQSKTLQSMAYAKGREEDIVIMKGMFGDAEQRTSSGHDGSWSNIALPSANIIPDEGLGFNSDKLLQIWNFFGNKFDVENPSMQLNLAIAQPQLTNMLGDPQFINSDFNTMKPLANGKVTGQGYMGFYWNKSNLIPYWGNGVGASLTWDSSGLPVDTTIEGLRAVIAWISDGVLFEDKSFETDIFLRSEKKNRPYALVEASMGATRLDEDKVCVCLCKES